MSNVFDKARRRGSRLSEADKTRIRKRIGKQLEEGTSSSYSSFLELRGVKEGEGLLANACTGTRSSGGQLSIEKIEEHLTQEMEDCLKQVGLSPSWREGVRGARSMGPSINLKDDAKDDPRVLGALRWALYANRSVAFVTGTGALMCPVVQSTPPRTHNKVVNLGTAGPGHYTPIWALAEALCATVSDLQMYFGSLMGARVKRGLDRGNYVPRCPVVLWDFSKSIGVDAASGRQVFLPDVDTDGGALASSGLLGAPGVQFRGFTLLGAEGAMWKGAMHSHPVRWSSELRRPVTRISCTEEEWRAATPCILMDANCPKGKSKDELLDILKENGFVLLPQAQTMLWAFADWGRGDWYGKDCMSLPLTFQDNVWLPADKSWFNEAKRSIWSLFRPRFQKINGVEIPVLDSTKKRDTERLLSGGTLRKARQLRARANRFLPFGSVMVDELVLRGGEFGEVAQGRAPTLQPHSKQCNLAFTRDGLLAMIEGKAPKEFNKLLNRHNQRANWFYGSDAADHTLTAEGMRERLLDLELSTRGVDLRGSFLANQLDASCREEDQDGDTTVCESNRWWTKRFGKAQTYWSGDGGVGPFRNELSSKLKYSYGHPLVTEALGHLHVKGAAPSSYAQELFEKRSLSEIWLKEAISDPQGPTGLFADLAADLAARIPFYKKGMTAAQVIAANKKHFLAWAGAALGCQISIDLQKKFILLWGFDLEVARRLMEGEEITEALLERLFKKALDSEELDMGNLAWLPKAVNGLGSHGFCPGGDRAAPISSEVIESIILRGDEAEAEREAKA